MSNKKSRREFLEVGIKAGILLPFATTGLYGCITNEKKPISVEEETPSNSLKILLLGGTSFLGPHQIAYALERGHEISTFTRGKTEPTIHKELFDKVEQLVGDRDSDLSALENRKWDAVIDNSGRKVEWTKEAASLLKDSCDTYVYTSSVSVFYPFVNSDFKEDRKVVLKVPEGTPESERPVFDYGVMKANSELAAINEFGEDRTIVVRPTLIVGPADKTDRFNYWPIRMQKGGEVLVPGKPTDKVQYIDVRDLAEWMIRLVEDKKSGTFNAVGPKTPQGIHSFADDIKKAFDSNPTLVKIEDHDFLRENNLTYQPPWILPQGKFEGMMQIDNSKAIENGLTLRSLTETSKDTYNWWASDAVSEERRTSYEASLNSIIERNKELIKKWKAR